MNESERFDFRSEVDRMMLIAPFLVELKLNDIIDAVDRAHTVGPFVDPTRYRDALQRGDMDRARRFAEALQEPARLARELIENVDERTRGKV